MEKRPSLRHVIAVFLAVMISGNPAVRVVDDVFIYPASFVVIIALVGVRLKKIQIADLFLFLAFAGIVILHFVEFGVVTLFASIGFLNKLMIAYVLAAEIPRFARIYTSLMVLLSFLSLGIFFADVIGLPIYELLSVLKVDAGGALRHVIVHNFGQAGLGRNSGVFWEPGAFGAYIVLALLLRQACHLELRSWQLGGLWLALLTTLSTAAFLAGFVVLVWWLHSVLSARKSGAVLILSPWLLVGFVFLAQTFFFEASFMAEKIAHQYDRATSGGYLYQINRIGNFFYDLELIMEKPLLGWSAYLQTRNDFDRYAGDFFSGQGNGLSGFVTSFGLLGAFVFFFCSAKRFWTTGSGYFGVAYFFTTIAILLTGQKLLNYPIFLMLPFFNYMVQPIYGRKHPNR